MKERVDNLLFQKGLAESREKAKSFVMAGIVYIEEVKVDKPGMKVDVDVNITVRGKTLAYVSRGGLKLEKAMQEFGVQLQDKVTMDVGASTGGFTDCMLQSGAVKVFAVDVGYGQLAWKLRSDDRVICMERTNIRYLTKEMIDCLVDFASIDVSFISLRKVLPAVIDLMTDKGEIVALIKPQFEAGRENVGKKGVVRDKTVHFNVIQDIVIFCYEVLKLNINKLTYSPVKGPEGNIEYLLYISKESSLPTNQVTNELIEEVVENSHNKL